VISYASNTQGRRNLTALREAGWRILLTPGQHASPPKGFRYAIDNGAWGCFKNNLPFDSEGFGALVESAGAGADFVVIPDKVAHPESLEFSKSWLYKLRHLKLILLAVQDGMNAKDVGVLLESNPNMGLFLGGSTEWKLKTMYGWGMVAFALRRYYHVARVNSMRRIKLCAEAGADSFDGTSCTRYSKNIPLLDAAKVQPHLLTPKAMAASEGA
jgi:hypothetical protein